jgi:putative protease
MRHIELLSPGGSMEGIRAAVHAGADAVYAGGRMFGARAFARNLETQELMEAIDYCHLHGAKLYLTVNTLLKEEELTLLLPEYLAPIYEHGVDAVLVQDFGVFRFLKKHFPDLSLHASTQMTVSGPDGVKLLREMGADRVVLSRELGLEEIRLIRSECDVELETFVHGALCYCYSGKCLMSSMIGGRSGNRGRCAQLCRLRYDF